MSNSIPLEVTATEDSFSEEGYLAANPDVKQAVARGDLTSGRSHFELFGRAEHRKQRLGGSAGLAEARRAKLARLRPHLRPDMPFDESGDRLDFLTAELRALSRIADTENESANGYDGDMVALIEKYAGGLILDCGAGRRDRYYSDVVNFEIVPYDTTDVLGVGEELPFRDGTFDCVFSVAVLEHVQDPFRCAREIARVIKPGGELFCSVPFLQPMHGYPHHYFNATKQGIRRLFEDRLRVDEVFVSHGGHPAFAMKWFLASWAQGLDEERRRAFRDLTVGELVDANPWEFEHRPVASLPPEKVDELACGFVLRATRA